MKRKCVQCGKDFFLSKSELDFYKSKNLAFPKRCKECRSANKKNKSPKQGNKPGKTDDGITNVKIDENAVSAVNNDMDITNPSSDSTAKKTGKGKKAIVGIAAALAIVAAAAGGNAYLQSDSADNMTVAQYYEQNSVEEDADIIDYTFKSDDLLMQHYEKHGKEMGFESPEEYEHAACLVANNPNALHKLEAEDGDDVYYLEETNEFVIVSTAGYIRTYYQPNSGIEYFNRQ